jgi:hypothetical protein
MCKGSEEQCSKTQNADPEDKEMKNRDLGYQGWFVWRTHTLKIPGTIFIATLRTEGLLHWTLSLSCRKTNSSYI